MPKKSPRSGVTKRLELEYEQSLRKVVAKMLPPKGSTSTIQEWIDSILHLSDSPQIQKLIQSLAGQMVRWVNVASARSWREAAARSQRSRMLYRLLQSEMRGSVGQRVRELVSENARLIRSIPVEAAAMTANEILKLQQQGARPKTIERAMRIQFPHHTRARIRLIARTETMKASAALTEARATHLGVQWYVWRTSHDQRVRTSHRHMEDVLVRYDRPPQPEALIGIRSTLGKYQAGNAPNCRCVQLPVLDFDDIRWPHKVFDGRTIRWMGKKEFEAIS